MGKRKSSITYITVIKIKNNIQIQYNKKNTEDKILRHYTQNQRLLNCKKSGIYINSQTKNLSGELAS